MISYAHFRFPLYLVASLLSLFLRFLSTPRAAAQQSVILLRATRLQLLQMCPKLHCMEINGLTLPSLFVQAIQQGQFRRGRSSWLLHEDVDAYGNDLQLYLTFYQRVKDIIEATNALSKDFQADGYYGNPEYEENLPGAIPDILDFTYIVDIGDGGDGSPVCLDYREDRREPSVIWWADAYWRRVAPDLASFLRLFDFTKRG